MLISEKLATAISTQVGREFGAMLQYLSIASYFDRESLPQLATRFYNQSEEEKMHAMKLAHYVTDAGGVLIVPAIAAPKPELQSAEEAVQLSLTWELEVAQQINDLVHIAMEESDFLAQNFLQWFVDEQLEEVNTMETLLRTVQRAGENLLQVEAFIARQPAPGAG